jgi:hypothetical protein
VLYVIIALIVLASACFAVYHLKRPRIHIPETVTQSVSFPIHVPKKLPMGYTLDEDSFKYIASEQVLVFQASDIAGDTLVFSEQARPANFDFTAFTNNQLANPKKLPSTPYPSTVGKTLDKQTTLVSIITDESWIIITTQQEFSNQELHDLAANITTY